MPWQPPMPEGLSSPVMRAVSEAINEMTETTMSDLAKHADAYQPVTFFPLEDTKPANKGTRAVTFIVEKLSQPSTIRGLLMLATSLGLVISPVAQEYILEIGMAVVGLVGILANK